VVGCETATESAPRKRRRAFPLPAPGSLRRHRTTEEKASTGARNRRHRLREGELE
jgi:hypothetical protein